MRSNLQMLEDADRNIHAPMRAVATAMIGSFRFFLKDSACAKVLVSTDVPGEAKTFRDRADAGYECRSENGLPAWKMFDIAWVPMWLFDDGHVV